jgi:hypothetical protein
LELPLPLLALRLVLKVVLKLPPLAQLAPFSSIEGLQLCRAQHQLLWDPQAHTQQFQHGTLLAAELLLCQ